MAAPVAQQLDTLEHDLRAMRVEFERFFAGGADIAPEALFFDIAGRIKNLRQHTRGVAESFRLGTLEAQFNSYREMYQRRLRSLELGSARSPRAASPGAPADETEVAANFDARRGVVVGERVPGHVVDALHRELCHGNSRLGSVDPVTLQGFLERQAADLRARTGCAQVRFRLVDEGGELRLKAKPVGAAD